jgi:hypothetical protein
MKRLLEDGELFPEFSDGRYVNVAKINILFNTAHITLVKKTQYKI